MLLIRVSPALNQLMRKSDPILFHPVWLDIVTALAVYMMTVLYSMLDPVSPHLYFIVYSYENPLVLQMSYHINTVLSPHSHCGRSDPLVHSH